MIDDDKILDVLLENGELSAKEKEAIDNNIYIIDEGLNVYDVVANILFLASMGVKFFVIDSQMRLNVEQANDGVTGIAIKGELAGQTEITIDKEGIHWKLKRREPKSMNTFSAGMEDLYLFQIALAAGLYMALVAKIAPYREDRYILNVYPMIMLILVWITKLVFQRFSKGVRGKWIAATVLCCVVLTGNVYPGVNYLYKGI